MSDQPPSLPAWSRFLGQLRRARAEQESGEGAAGLPPGLSPHMRWIKAFHDLLLETGHAAELGPLPFKLLEAIGDIHRGNIPPMFQPERPASRPVHRIEEANLIAMAVRAMDELLQAGRSRKAAVNEVLPLVKARMPRVVEGTLLNWRRELQRADPAMSRDVLARYQAPLPPVAGNSPEKRAAWLLYQLAHAPALG